MKTESWTVAILTALGFSALGPGLIALLFCAA